MKKNWVLKKVFGFSILFLVIGIATFGFTYGNFRYEDREVLKSDIVPGALFIAERNNSIFFPSTVVVMTDYGRKVEYTITRKISGEIEVKEVEKNLIASR